MDNSFKPGDPVTFVENDGSTIGGTVIKTIHAPQDEHLLIQWDDGERSRVSVGSPHLDRGQCKS